MSAGLEPLTSAAFEQNRENEASPAAGGNRMGALGERAFAVGHVKAFVFFDAGKKSRQMAIRVVTVALGKEAMERGKMRLPIFFGEMHKGEKARSPHVVVKVVSCRRQWNDVERFGIDACVLLLDGVRGVAKGVRMPKLIERMAME